MPQAISTAPESATATVSGIELRAATLAYGRTVVVSRATLRVPLGSLAALVGPGGAGKSSLLACLAGRLEPRAGEARVLGRPIAEVRSRLAYAPRGDQIDWRFPISLAEVVVMGRFRRLGPLRRPRRADWELVERSLEQVGLAGLGRRRVAELSGAQRRRALLARALVQEPEVLLVDDPWPALEGADEDLLELFAVLRQQGKTSLLATRDLACVSHRFDWVVLLNGRVVAEGRPADALTVQNVKQAYGTQRVPMRVPATTFAVDA